MEFSVKREDVLQQEILPDAGPPTTAGGAEKRIHPRVPVSIGVEIVDTRTRVRITGRATDFGVGGCYVDTMTTLPKGTQVDVFLQWQTRTLHLRALVTYAVDDRSIGMGLSFIGSATDQETTLLDWMNELGGNPPPRARENAAPQIKSVAETLSTKPLGLKDVVEELVALLVNKRVLTDSEAHRLYGDIHDI